MCEVVWFAWFFLFSLFCVCWFCLAYLNFFCSDTSKVWIPSISLGSVCSFLLGMRILCLSKIKIKSSISHLEQISVISVWRRQHRHGSHLLQPVLYPEVIYKHIKGQFDHSWGCQRNLNDNSHHLNITSCLQTVAETSI